MLCLAFSSASSASKMPQDGAGSAAHTKHMPGKTYPQNRTKNDYGSIAFYKSACYAQFSLLLSSKSPFCSSLLITAYNPIVRFHQPIHFILILYIIIIIYTICIIAF